MSRFKTNTIRRPFKPGLALLSLVLLVISILFLSPFYFVIVNSLKSYGEVLMNAGSLPKKLAFENYAVAWNFTKFPVALFNSLLITTVSLVIMVLFGAMAAWRMVRRPGKITAFIFSMFVVAMVVPFQSVMIPMMKVTSTLSLLNSRLGIIVIYLGFGMPFTVFLLHGFVKGVPKELEESSFLVGCNSFQTFWHIVLPLMRSIVATVAILQTFWIWNDFLLPLLVLFDPTKRTIPLAVFSFFGQYTDRWDYALATLIMGMIPIVIFFLALQRFIIRGVAAGSLKG